MKVFLAVVAVLVMGSATVSAQTWESFNAGMEKAKAQKKTVLVDIYTDWCSWCKKMDANVYTDAKVKDYLKKKYTIIKLNAESTTPIMYKGKQMSPAEFAQGMGVTGYPATLFMKSNGDGITLVPGYAEAPKFLEILTYIGENRWERQKFEDYLKEIGSKN
ncbi:MAG TPA: thioredoxin family protein [Bacteroidota bacterium]|nr:thioredoxin family protein [Bacteroidota bacterium]